MGCIYEGYCSDMTRTIFVDVVQDYIKPVYDLVLKNQEQIANEIREGMLAKTLFKMVDNDFKLHNYSLVHALGHSVGLEIHENPTLSQRDETLLKENMIITNEPGIYIPGKFGVRIEDTCLVTKSGCANLTNSDRSYVII